MHPIAYSAQYEGEGRNRLTVFFRYFMVIPLMLVAIVYGIGVFFSAIIAWFALVITGKYPQGLYDFNAGVVRFSARVNGYFYLLTDRYPSFGLDEDYDYPVRTLVEPAKAEYSRMKALFRAILLIPVYILTYVMSLITAVVAFIVWFAILFTGKLSDGLYKPLRASLAYQTKAAGYFLLLTEDFPPFWVDEEEEAPRFGGQLGAGNDPYAQQLAADPYAQQQAPPPPPPPPPPAS